MNRQFLWDGFGWGIVLWFVGYVLGIVLFVIVPPAAIGWVIMPIGVVVTLWVLFKKISDKPYSYYVRLAALWTMIAVVFDYVFLVRVFNPADGYYKLDVYLYYVLTFLMPLLVGLRKTHSAPAA